MAKPRGVIDALSAGYSAVNRQLWVLLLPVLLDLFLWMGPQVSFAPLVEPVLLRASQAVRATDTAVAARGTRLAPDLGTNVEELRQELMQRTSTANAFELVTYGPLALPSAAGLLSTVRGGEFSFVTSWGAGVALLTGSLLSSLLLGSLYRGLIAQRVRDATNRPLAAFQRLPRAALSVVGLVLILLGVLLLLALPVVIVLAATAAAVPAVGLLGVLVLSVALAFAQIHLLFAVDAIFVSGVGPLAAVQRSVAVARGNVWQTVGLLLVSWLILAGLGEVWAQLARIVQPPWGALLGTLGNAYIASGLVAASMIFYKERADRLGVDVAAPSPAVAASMEP